MLEHFQRDLTQEQRVALTMFKWAYTARANYGFDLATSRRLAFMRWLVRTERVND